MNSKSQALQSQLFFAAAKNSSKTQDTTSEMTKLEELSTSDHRALFVCRSCFPFDLFPDVITVDRNKITISQNFFFFTRSVQSIVITDLLTIIVDETLLFARLQIVDRLFHQDPIEVNTLLKSDARKLRWILEGLIIGKKEKIDFTKISNEELLPKLQRIGMTKTA